MRPRARFRRMLLLCFGKVPRGFAQELASRFQTPDCSSRRLEAVSQAAGHKAKGNKGVRICSCTALHAHAIAYAYLSYRIASSHTRGCTAAEGHCRPVHALLLTLLTTTDTTDHRNKKFKQRQRAERTQIATQRRAAARSKRAHTNSMWDLTKRCMQKIIYSPPRIK
jgi:putative component of membrane protein insertase Oxa1/YidC/SpoIIIJ protein YidD